MGIRPTGGTPIQLPSSNAQDQAAELVGSLETSGEVLGEQLGRIDATSRSANTVSTEMAVQIADIQSRLSALENDPGPDLSGYATVSRVATLEGRVETLEKNVAVFGTCKVTSDIPTDSERYTLPSASSPVLRSRTTGLGDEFVTRQGTIFTVTMVGTGTVKLVSYHGNGSSSYLTVATLTESAPSVTFPLTRTDGDPVLTVETTTGVGTSSFSGYLIVSAVGPNS